MPSGAASNGPRIQSYLDAWRRRGPTASEGDLYDVFANHIVRGLLGYTSDEYNITPRGKRGSGAPDLRLKTSDGVAWVAVEAKKDDRLIRSNRERERLWRDKQKYVDDQTAYFLWVAPKTLMLCDASGEPIASVRLEAGQANLDLDIAGEWASTTEDAVVADLLAPIAAEAGRERAYLERFRAGELVYGHIKLTRDNVHKLTHSLSDAVGVLLQYLDQSLVRLKLAYATYLSERPVYEEQIKRDLWSANPDEFNFRTQAALRAFERRHARAIAFHQAFEDFCSEQAYTKYEKERNETEQTALERIFRANAAYVAIGRLLFVRLAEDQGLINPKISNGGLELWNKILGHGALVARWVGLAFADAQRVCEQLFTETPFDTLLVPDDSEFDQALLGVLFRLNAFDFSGLGRDVDVLGAIYQGILDRKLRKDLGEFYTDQEVVEYILSRVGLKAKAQEGGQVSLLDPACGSGAFLVRAAGLLREADQKRSLPPADVQERINAAIHGLDINHFAVYIADMNLLFATFDLTAQTRQAARFSVHRTNSLLKELPFRVERANGSSGDAFLQAIERQTATYQFVVGNPPYVRAERLPDDDRRQLKAVYESMHGAGNVDLAVYFVRRALDWLEPGGMLGFILPRAIADAAFSGPLRSTLESEVYTIEELVPLDWACHELFDSDVVPFLLFVRQAKRPADHQVTLVQRLRSKEDLLERAKGLAPAGTRTSKIPWPAFIRHSAAGWPMEMTQEDVPVLDAMASNDRLGKVAEPRFGIKAGSGDRAGDLTDKRKREGDWFPMLTGADIHAFFSEEARRAVLLNKAEDPSVWAALKSSRASLPEDILAVAEIYVSLSAAVIRPNQVCCQNNVVVVRQQAGASASPHALCALVNSRAARYYAFLTLRAGVAGGGRRDFTIYPRTLSALPIPGLADSEWDRLAQLSLQAHEAGARRAQSELEIWRACMPKGKKVMLREWPLDFSGWPDGWNIRDKDYAPRLDESAQTLWLTPEVSISGDVVLLEYLGNHLAGYWAEAGNLSKQDFVRQKVVSPDGASAALSALSDALAERTKAEDTYFEVVGAIDEIVEQGLGLSPKLRARLAQRMTEFPLNENANRPRLPWEETKKPKARLFVAGERYHTQ